MLGQVSRELCIKDINARSIKSLLILEYPVQIPIFDIWWSSLYDENDYTVETDFNIDIPHCSP